MAAPTSNDHVCVRFQLGQVVAMLLGHVHALLAVVRSSRLVCTRRRASLLDDGQSEEPILLIEWISGNDTGRERSTRTVFHATIKIGGGRHVLRQSNHESPSVKFKG